MPQPIDAAIRPRGTSIGFGGARRALIDHSRTASRQATRAAIYGRVAQNGSVPVSTYSSWVNMLQPKSAGRILLAVTLGSSSAIDAYGFSSASFLHPSIQQEELTMSFVAWVAIGLAAGFIGGRLANRSGKSIMPDVLLGVVGGVTGGWLFYAFGPPGVNGIHLQSHLAAVFGSLVFLLTYYGFRRV